MRSFTVSADNRIQLDGIPMNGRALLVALRDYLHDWPEGTRSTYSAALLAAMASWVNGVASLHDDSLCGDEQRCLIRATLTAFSTSAA